MLLLVPASLCPAQEKTVQPTHAPDGGTIERFASITIPTTPGAPFTATVNTEWVRQVPDGGNIILVNHRTVARDANGRVFEERAYFVPSDGKQKSVAYQIEISDPATHDRYICRIAEHVCRLQQFFSNYATAAVAPDGSASAGTPGLTVENLGSQNVAGLETVGTRETRLIETASIGNEAPLLEKKEFWYSPDLGINLITRRQDPRFSSQQNFEVNNIQLGEPDAKLFEPPAGFRILDLRKPPEVATPANSSPN